MGVHVSGIQDADIIVRHLKEHIEKGPKLSRKFRLLLPLQLIALMTPIAGWLAHRFAAGSNDLPPVWSLITDSPIEKEYP